MRRTRSSILQVSSLQPELEFELLKLVLLRERYIQRLQKALNDSSGRVDISLIGLFDTLRDCSIEIVETIVNWERSFMYVLIHICKILILYYIYA